MYLLKRIFGKIDVTEQISFERRNRERPVGSRRGSKNSQAKGPVLDETLESTAPKKQFRNEESFRF